MIRLWLFRNKTGTKGNGSMSCVSGLLGVDRKTRSASLVLERCLIGVVSIEDPKGRTGTALQSIPS
jgi:hypothetical protein